MGKERKTRPGVYYKPRPWYAPRGTIDRIVDAEPGEWVKVGGEWVFVSDKEVDDMVKKAEMEMPAAPPAPADSEPKKSYSVTFGPKVPVSMVPPDTKNCPKCNAAIPPKYKFCSMCGHEFQSWDEEEEVDEL